ncbi:MAG TPA: hypothetical protein VKI64_00435, partial [Acidimicrobiales bacterium]|nr:hypothetical protein [Acidimicrobiales bacterium]
MPKGSERWAQVPAGASYQEAPPVWLLRGAPAVVVVVAGWDTAVVGGGAAVVVVGRGGGAVVEVVEVVVVGGGGGVEGVAAPLPAAELGSRSTTTAAPTAAIRTSERLGRDGPSPAREPAALALTSAARTEPGASWWR